MKAIEITPGDRLLLKLEAKERYGATDPIVTVTSTHTRDGYKVPWIIGTHSELGEGAFKPSDFARRVAETASEANARVASLTTRKRYT